MAKTTNLGLELTTDPATLFEAWRKAINGSGDGAEEEKSNMQIIDEFAGAIYGVSGTVTLTDANWSDGAYTLTVAALGANDAIFFSAASAADKAKADAANLFVSASGTSVTFNAQTTPTQNITFKYFISRGK